MASTSASGLAEGQWLFGRPLREKYFMFDKDYVPLNHGSFGAFPTPVRDRMRELSAQCEAKPDTYIRYDLPAMLEDSRKVAADLLNANPSDIVFVPNATTAGNVILRALDWQKGDVILTLDIIYSGFDKTVEYIVESTPAETESVDCGWPVEDDVLVAAFESKIQQIRAEGRRVRLAIFDTISSMPSVRLPFERLVQKCRELGVLSFLDGAQGVGQIPIDLGSVQPDFFCTNIHKWFYTPRGSAIFYASENCQPLIRSSVPTSHGFKPLPRLGQRAINNPFPPAIGTSFQELFGFVGTANTDAYLTVPTAQKFRNEVCGGEEKIIDYCIQLAKEGGKRAARAFGTEVFGADIPGSQECAMTNVRLPLEIGDGEGQIPQDKTRPAGVYIAKEAAREGTFFAVILYRDQVWWRISAAAYLEIGDIEWGIRTMGRICENVRKGLYEDNASQSKL